MSGIILFLILTIVSINMMIGWALIAYLFIDAKRSHYESTL